MKTAVKFLYLIVFIFFSLTSKPLRLLGVYQQERFLKVAKEVSERISSAQAVKLTGEISKKVNELNKFIVSQKTLDLTHQSTVLLTNEVNELVSALVIENKNNFLYRCLVWFTSF